MTNVLEMCPNLVGTTRFQIALHECYVAQIFQHFVVRDGPFSLAFIVVNHLHFTIFYRATNITGNGAIGRVGNSPDDVRYTYVRWCVRKIAGPGAS